MKEYSGLSGKERLASLKITKKAIKDGSIPKPSKCQICGRTSGRIDYHNETYTSPTENLFQICQGCHMRWHNRKRFPDAFNIFFIEEGRHKLLNDDMIKALKNEGYKV